MVMKMCELLGMSFNLPVRPSISFRGFRLRSKENPHGWGLAFYPDESAQVIKEPIKAKKSRLSEFLRDYELVRSKIFIAHVRYTSVGKISHKNTHPFYRELNGKEYVFAHNGTLHGYKALKLGRFSRIGETDSEYVFCHLLSCIEERKIEKWTKEDFDWLAKKLSEINDYGTFNCIFSDGEYLFCYHDKNGYKGLCFDHRKPPYSSIRLLDEDWEINLAEEKDLRQTGFIIATRRLTDEPWMPFKAGELIVFKDGKMVYSNQRDVSLMDSVTSSLTDLEITILRVIRKSPHRLSLRDIIDRVNRPEKDVRENVHSLLCKGYIVQDSRDIVDWSNYKATFYTNPPKRKEIDKLIKQNK